jgi:hypothetical protein
MVADGVLGNGICLGGKIERCAVNDDGKIVCNGGSAVDALREVVGR